VAGFWFCVLAWKLRQGELAEFPLRAPRAFKPWGSRMHPRRARKRSAALRAIESLWPNGIPEDVRPFDAAKRVRHWLTDYCRREGFPQISIAYETIRDAISHKRGRGKLVLDPARTRKSYVDRSSQSVFACRPIDQAFGKEHIAELCAPHGKAQRLLQMKSPARGGLRLS
jgi:hypothetical protein